MIEILKFIEDLKEIRKSMPYTNISSELVDSKIKKYEKIVSLPFRHVYVPICFIPPAFVSHIRAIVTGLAYF